jgi:pimeloyl-ACP methyl ester carboxylesterase
MKDLIILHGALGSSKEFQTLKTLLKDDFKVHLLDFEGHGDKKTSQPFTIQLFADNLTAYIEEQRLNQVNVFGYSMGGYVALYLAAQSNQKLGKIVTLGTKFLWNPEVAQNEVRKLNPAIIQEKVPRFATYLESVQSDWVLNMEKTAEMMLKMGDHPPFTTKEAERVKQEVTCALGELDEMVSESETIEIQGSLPNGRFIQLEGLKHPISTIQPEILAEFIKKEFKHS